MLICPVCGAELIEVPGRLACQKGHSFDVAKEGYVNLLRSGRSGDLIGDDKLSARSRRDFLNLGYYGILREFLVETFRNCSGKLLDICCGEGYYTSAIGHPGLDVYGFDISKEMVRLAAKRGNGTYFVANMASIPVADNAFDHATHLFAPFHEKEFCRVLKPGGKLYTVIPGRKHLFGLKEVLYDTPYVNDEKLPVTEKLKPVRVTKLSDEIQLKNAGEIDAVFRMTPYYYHTSQKDKDKLTDISRLSTSVEFVVAEYEKAGE